MTVADLLAGPERTELELQRLVNAFVDEFRRADDAGRRSMVREGPPRSGRREGLVASVVSALCREVGCAPPDWVARTHSPAPYFAFPAQGYALRVRLMLEAPAAFRARNVFVPKDYLSRA